MPYFGGLDFTLKKIGHAIGYGLLAMTILHGLQYSNTKSLSLEFSPRQYDRPPGFRLRPFIVYFLAWLTTILYSVTDEFHQSYVPGRNPSIWDILVFDNFGAIFGLWIIHLLKSKQR